MKPFCCCCCTTAKKQLNNSTRKMAIRCLNSQTLILSTSPKRSGSEMQLLLLRRICNKPPPSTQGRCWKTRDETTKIINGGKIGFRQDALITQTSAPLLSSSSSSSSSMTTAIQERPLRRACWSLQNPRSLHS